MRFTSLRYLLRLCVLSVLSGVILAGCDTAPSVPTATPSREEAQQQPTATPPAWQEPFEPVTQETARNIVPVGRLDAPLAEGGSVFAHSFSIDGTRLAGLTNEQLVVWDVVTGETVFAATRQGVIDVFFSPDKVELYTIVPDGTVNVVEADSGFTRDTFLAHPDFVNNQFAYHADSGTLAVTSIQGDVRVWNTLERQAVANLETLNLDLNTLAFSADGALLAVGDTQGDALVWDWQADAVIATLDPTLELSIERLTFSPDGTQLAVATDEDIRVWDIATEMIEHVLLTERGGSSDVLAYTPDGSFIVNSGTAEAMNVWNPQTGELLAAIPELGGEPTAVAFSPDGTLMLTSVFQGGSFMWDLSTIGAENIQRAALGDNALIIDVAWSDDGRTLALFATDGSVFIWGIPDTAPAATEEAID